MACQHTADAVVLELLLITVVTSLFMPRATVAQTRRRFCCAAAAANRPRGATAAWCHRAALQVLAFVDISALPSSRSCVSRCIDAFRGF